MWNLLSGVAVAALLATGSTAFGQTKQKAPETPRSAASLECSKQADEKGLHGKARKAFRSKCLKNLKKTA